MKRFHCHLILCLSVSALFLWLPHLGHAEGKVVKKIKPPVAATTEFKKHQEAIQVQRLLDKLIMVGSKLQQKTRVFKVSNKLQEAIIFRNELTRDLAVLSGLNSFTQIDITTFEAGQWETDPGTVDAPSMPSISVPVNSGCATQEMNCLGDAADAWGNCRDNCGVSCEDCSDELGRNERGCHDQRRGCNSCERRGGKNCAGKIAMTNDFEEWISQLLGYLTIIEEMIDMQNFTHEFDANTIDFYNSVVDVTYDFISPQ